MSASTICHGCGQRLLVPADYPRAKMRCPECGVMCDVPPQARPAQTKPAKRRAAPIAAPQPAPLPPEPPVAEADLPIPLAPEPLPPVPRPKLDFGTDEDDGKPYRTADGPEFKCPHCSQVLEPETTHCPGCGCDLATGKKPKRVYEPAERSWEAGMPLRTRKLLFLIGVGLAIVLGVPIAIGTESWIGAVISWIIFVGLIAFLLGSYSRVDLSRTKRGKVTLTQTWRLCFFERPPTVFNFLEFQAVRTGYVSDVNFMDWIIAFLLLPSIVLAIFWWYIFIQRDQHTVTLVREHAYGSDVLYRGVSEQMAKEMARAIEEIGGLKYENG